MSPACVFERFGPSVALAAIRPGIIYVSLSAYGHSGAWAEKRGFDSILQTASGFNAEEALRAGEDTPKPLPCQALDHASGYLMAFAAMMAMVRRMREGGSWHVRISLARTGHWIRGLGRLDSGFDCIAPEQSDIGDLLEESVSGFGHLRAVRRECTRFVAESNACKEAVTIFECMPTPNSE